jgi:hypothetical protein
MWLNKGKKKIKEKKLVSHFKDGCQPNYSDL